MQEAKNRLWLTWQATPIRAHRLQQPEGAHDVGLDEVFRAVDGAVNVRLCCKIDNGAGLVLAEQSFE